MNILIIYMVNCYANNTKMVGIIIMINTNYDNYYN